MIIKNRCTLKAFTLAEMMIVLLVLSIITAAFVPIMTKRSRQASAVAGNNDNPWVWGGTLNNDAVFSIPGNTGAIIGATAFDPAENAKLLINSGGGGQDQILFKQAGLQTGHLNFNINRNIELLPSNTSDGSNIRDNVGIGTSLGIGRDNSFLGFGSGGATSGSSNVAIGREALGSAANSGSQNTAVGINALFANTTGYSNVGIGPSALYSNTDGHDNVALGFNANYGINKSYTISIGSNALAEGNFATAIGCGDLSNSTKASGAYSTALGFNSKAAGEDSTALGRATNASGAHSTALGYVTTASGEYSTALGSRTTTASGANSIALGYVTKATGAFSTALGPESTASGEDSTALGFGTTASMQDSTALGSLAEATGNLSTALGCESNASGADSIAMGGWSDASGTNSIAIGFNTTASGTSSTSLGDVAKATGEYSTALGYSAKANGMFSVQIGMGTNDIGNSIQLGHESGAHQVYIPGSLKIGSSSVSSISASNGVLSITSDIRLKNIKSQNNDGLDKISKLQVFNFTFKKDKEKVPRVGVIAQDLQKVFPNAVTKDKKGFLMIRQDDMFYAMINAIKELDAMFQGFVKDFKSLVAKVQTLDDKVVALVKVDQVNSQKIDAIYKELNEIKKENKQLKSEVQSLKKKIK